MKEKLIVYAKDLRRRSTDAEQILWSHIRAKRLEGLKFRRQHPIGKYIVDFICLERKIVIELDGGQHTEPEKREYDRERDNWLEKEGYRVLRFCDNDVLLNIRGVLEVIREDCIKHPPLHPLPSREGKEEISPLRGERKRSTSHSRVVIEQSLSPVGRGRG